MSLALQIIEATFEQSSSYLTSRTNLDLPRMNSSLALSPYQQEALDLAISNSPIALISGEPGSGKTHVGYLALNMAVQSQKSTLLVASHSNTLEAYENLQIRPLRLDKSNSYMESITAWLREQFAQPKLDFFPAHLLRDPLLEILQTLPNSNHWLNLARSEENSILKQELKSIFSQTSETRLNLLAYRLHKCLPLLEQRNRLKQNYANLSSQAIFQLVEATMETAKIPIIGTLETILKTEIRLKSFDLIVIEDSHLFSDKDLTLIARMTDKLILLGEDIYPHTYFARLSQRLSFAYRVRLRENFRLHSSLARVIFPYFYNSQPYTPLQNYRAFQNRLLWFDIRNCETISSQLFNFLETLDLELEMGVLTFSTNMKEMLQEQCPQQQQNRLLIDILENWLGKECDVLLIACDGTQPTIAQLRLALTRASEAIACFGDINQYYKSEFTNLFKAHAFQIEREVSL